MRQPITILRSHLGWQIRLININLVMDIECMFPVRFRKIQCIDCRREVKKMWKLTDIRSTRQTGAGRTTMTIIALFERFAKMSKMKIIKINIYTYISGLFDISSLSVAIKNADGTIETQFFEREGKYRLNYNFCRLVDQGLFKIDLRTLWYKNFIHGGLIQLVENLVLYLFWSQSV